MLQNETANVNSTLAQNILIDILKTALHADQFSWIEKTIEELQTQWDSMSMHLAFGMVARKIPREHIEDARKYEDAAQAILPGWCPYLWTKDRIARVLILSIPQFDTEEQARDFIWDMFDTADMWEQVAIFSALPILPFPHVYTKIASEGLRTNMAPVFDSVAMENPYPGSYFSEDAWNQMYLKAAFMQRPLYRIQSIPKRANENLSRIVLDYVDERWAAGREISPEIWQACSGFLSPNHIQALSKLKTHTEETQRAVIDLVRKQNDIPEFQDLELDLTQTWSWESLGKQYNSTEVS